VARALDQLHEYAPAYREMLTEDPKTVERRIQQTLEQQGPGHFDMPAAIEKVKAGLQQLGQPEANLELQSGTAVRSRPKRTPVKAKPVGPAPLRGQRDLFDPNKVAHGTPTQLGLFGGGLPIDEAKLEPVKPAADGQLDLFVDQVSKALDDYVDPTFVIFKKNDLAYRRIKRAWLARGYGEADFQPGGPLYGKSVNELRVMLTRGKAD
jgi:hypothetical protein